MEYFQTVDEILDFAIDGEQEAYDFYTRMAGLMKQPHMANVFKEFARQELGHKAKLEKVKEGGALMPVQGKVQDLKIAEYAVDVSDSPDLNYQDALILAMKREKAAFKLYTQLAEISEDENLRNTFLALAQEEARHKLRIEVEYDDNILGEN